MVDTPRNGRAWCDDTSIPLHLRACNIRAPGRAQYHPVFDRLAPVDAMSRAAQLVEAGEDVVTIHQPENGRSVVVATLSKSGTWVFTAGWLDEKVRERIAMAASPPLRFSVGGRATTRDA